MRVHENGRFTPHEGGTVTAYRNVYRWQWTGHCLSLAHERFGAEAPVLLVDLVPADGATLVAEQPHLCGRDRYHARVRPISDGLMIAWRISGPDKDEYLHAVYRVHAPMARSEGHARWQTAPV